MASGTVISRGRGRGRGLGKGWVDDFKPAPPALQPEEIDATKFEDAEEINNLVFEDKPSYNKQTSVENISSQIANNILSTSDTINDEKAAVNSRKSGIENRRLEVANCSSISDSKESLPFMADEKPAVTVNSNKEKEFKDTVHENKPIIDSVLLNSVNAKEFIPSAVHVKPSLDAETLTDGFTLPTTSVVSSVICPPQGSRPALLRTPSFSEEQVAIDVLKDIIATLLEDPGDFDNVKEQLGEHLKNFVTKKETLKEIVSIMIEQAVTEPGFRYISAKLSHYFDSSKCLELDDGTTFRDYFYKRCQEEFKVTKTLLSDPISMKSSESLQRIANTAMLFGELLCNMKVKDTVNVVFKNVTCKYVDMFLESQSTELIRCLTQLLKLVGPELDIDRPKDVEAMFNKVKDFYYDAKKSEFLPSDLKQLVLRVYKLHSRDWDREVVYVPNSPVLTDFKEAGMFPLPVGVPDEAPKRRISEGSRTNPVDWGEFYAGDDIEIYQKFFVEEGENDEEFDAYEEFLRSTGQL